MPQAGERQAVRLPLLSPQWSIMTIFFTQAFAGGGLFPRIPDIQVDLSLSEGVLGLTLMGQPVGAFVSIVFSSWLIEHLGPKRILLIAVPMIAVATVLIALMPDALSTFGAMMLYGMAFAFANMAMNVEADRVEAATGELVMNRCHGMWSLGFLISSALGAFARGVPLSPFVHFALALPPVFAVTAFAIWPMRVLPSRPHAGPVRKKKIFVLPTAATLMLVGVILAGIMADASVRAWSVIFMRDSFDVPDFVDALTLPAFLLTLTTGRLIGDKLVARVGAGRLAAALIVLAFAGLALVLTAGNPYQAIGGFAVIGAGVSVLFPLTMSAAARIGDRPASENVTSISLVTNIVMLGTPGLIGFIAEAYGIRSAYLLLAPIFLVALALSPRLAQRPAHAR